MNKLTIGILAFIACLLLLAGFLVALFALIDAISLGAVNIWRAFFALPFIAAGAKLYAVLDRECDKRP